MSAGLILDGMMYLPLVLGLFLGYWVGFSRGYSAALASWEPRLRKVEADAEWYIENYRSMRATLDEIAQGANAIARPHVDQGSLP